MHIRVGGRIHDDRTTARPVLRKGNRTTFRGSIDIELRGQSSRRFPKKSRSFELQDRAGDNRDARLLGMPADDDWVLYAPYSEKTLMRNVLAYATARSMGRYRQPHPVRRSGSQRSLPRGLRADGEAEAPRPTGAGRPGVGAAPRVDVLRQARRRGQALPADGGQRARAPQRPRAR
nr:CotH kinase family protein [Nocardioides sp. B-3]